MRDPKRIQRVLKVIEKIWKQFPDSRLGQLLENAGTKGHCIFYVEDEQLVEMLNKFRELHGNSKVGKGKNRKGKK